MTADYLEQAKICIDAAEQAGDNWASLLLLSTGILATLIAIAGQLCQTNHTTVHYPGPTFEDREHWKQEAIEFEAEEKARQLALTSAQEKIP
jgi:hypothetical protein